MVERHGELGVGDEGRDLEREHVERVDAQLGEREVHALAELLGAVRLPAALMGVDLEKDEREEKRKRKELWSLERRRCGARSPQ